MAEVGETAAIVLACRRPIEIERDLQLFDKPFGKDFREFDTFVHGRPGHWDEGTDIESPEPRVLAAMAAHVDPFGGHPGGGKSALDNALGIADKGKLVTVFAPLESFITRFANILPSAICIYKFFYHAVFRCMEQDLYIQLRPSAIAREFRHHHPGTRLNL